MKRLAWLLWLLLASPAIAGQVVLSWDPPTTNTDGTPLTDLGGYKLYYGTGSGSYGSVIDVGNVITYTVTGLLDGTYYFAVTAHDTLGNESNFSNEVFRTIASVAIPAPNALQAVGTGGTVTLSWDKPNYADIVGYQISRGSSAGLYNTFYDVGPAQTSSASCVIGYTGCVRKQHIWYNTFPGTYTYTLRGYDSQGNASAYAGAISVLLSTDAILPADVTNFSAATLTDTSIRLTWTNPSDPDFSGVKIEYAFNNTISFVLLVSLKGYPGAQQAYNHYNLVPGTYNYRIHTKDTSGNITSTEHANVTLRTPIAEANPVTQEPPVQTDQPKRKKENDAGFGCGTIKNDRSSGGGGTDASIILITIPFVFALRRKLQLQSN